MKVIPERFVRKCVLLAHKRLRHGESLSSVLSDLIHDVYAMGAASEREECARVAFNSKTYIQAAKAIRSRGN